MRIARHPVVIPLRTMFQCRLSCKRSLNSRFNNGSEPLTILGIVVAAVARRLVPNCSAPMVTNIAQKPVLKPSAVHTRYMVVSFVFNELKKKIVETMVKR